MKNTNKLSGILFTVAGVLFLVSAVTSKQYVFYGLALCFVALGVTSFTKPSQS